MSFMSLKEFLSRKDIRILIICTASGGILQILSKEYLKHHPEFLNTEPVIKKNYRPLRFLPPRGGALIEISGISIKVVAKVVLNFLAKKGLIAGLATGGVKVISKIPPNAVSKYLSDAFPQNLPHLEKRKFILVGGEKIYLDYCNQNLKYLFKILEDDNIPFEEKERVARSILTKYLNLQTMTGRVNFVICIGFIFYILFNTNTAGFYLLLQNLIKAIKEGKISKAVGRAIVRRLQKRGVVLDPELLEVLSS